VAVSAVVTVVDEVAAEVDSVEVAAVDSVEAVVVAVVVDSVSSHGGTVILPVMLTFLFFLPF
jgi:hypothetical protein